MSGLNYGSKYQLRSANKIHGGENSIYKTIYKINMEEKVVESFKTIDKCCSSTGLNKSTLRHHIRTGKEINGFYYSYNKYINPTTEIF